MSDRQLLTRRATPAACPAVAWQRSRRRANRGRGTTRRGRSCRRRDRAPTGTWAAHRIGRSTRLSRDRQFVQRLVDARAVDRSRSGRHNDLGRHDSNDPRHEIPQLLPEIVANPDSSRWNAQTKLARAAATPGRSNYDRDMSVLPLPLNAIEHYMLADDSADYPRCFSIVVDLREALDESRLARGDRRRHAPASAAASARRIRWRSAHSLDRMPRPSLPHRLERRAARWMSRSRTVRSAAGTGRPFPRRPRSARGFVANRVSPRLHRRRRGRFNSVAICSRCTSMAAARAAAEMPALDQQFVGDA